MLQGCHGDTEVAEVERRHGLTRADPFWEDLAGCRVWGLGLQGLSGFRVQGSGVRA